MHRLLIAALVMTAAPAYADEDACKLVGQTMKAGELTRAWLLVDACAVEDDERGAKLGIMLDAKFEELHYARVDIETRPSGGTVVLDLVADIPFDTPYTVWLPPGVHVITALVDGQPVASTTLNLKSDGRGMAIIDLPGAPPPDNEVREIDFGEEGGPPELTTGPPEDEKFKSLLPDRFLRGVDANGETAVAGEPRGEWWIGMGWSTRASLGAAIGAQRRYRIAGRGTTVGLALDAQAVAGYDDGGVGSFGGALLLTGGFELFEQRNAYVRVTFGAGPGGAVDTGPDGSDASPRVVFAVELTITPKWSVNLRGDLDPWHREVENRYASIQVGRRW